jgi:hypothetical protein
MIYSELYDQVIAKTNRPELSRETQIAIRQATLKMHSLEWFTKDLANATIVFPTVGTLLTLPISTNLLRCRRVLQVLQDGEPLEYLQANEVFAKSGAQHNNSWWAIGDSLVIRTQGYNKTFSVSWFVSPLVDSPLVYNSWIAEAHPYAIIDEAARIIAEMTGRAELAASLSRAVGTLPLNGGLASGHVSELLRNNEVAGW